jgi:hypothetical protein
LGSNSKNACPKENHVSLKTNVVNDEFASFFGSFQTDVSLTPVKKIFQLFGNKGNRAYVCDTKVE